MAAWRKALLLIRQDLLKYCLLELVVMVSSREASPTCP